jgi:2-dehydropantoate 2-reductase
MTPLAVLGPGGVGGLVAAALARPDGPLQVGWQAGAGEGVAGADTASASGAQHESPKPEDRRSRVVVVARESTAATIAEAGLRVRSVLLGDFTAHPRALTRLEEPVDALIVATKAAGLHEALDRVAAEPQLVLPLLNGLDHIAALRERFGDATVVAGTIRVEADRPQPGVVVHTSRFLRIDMASKHASARTPMERLAEILSEAGVPARVHPLTTQPATPLAEREEKAVHAPTIQPATPPAERAQEAVYDWEAQVMWSKLVRLNALACTTSAYNRLLGEIRSTPELRADLVGAIEEGCAVASAEGASIPTGDPLGELTAAHATLGSSMQRDILAGRPPELDAIPGAVLRAAARHNIACPTIQRLVDMIIARTETSCPRTSGPLHD